MFEGLSDVELIDFMGEVTRDESTAIAQRLAAVAELFVRRQGALADTEWWCADWCDAVAAEVSAVQNISHARAVGQVQFACALRVRLPAVARLFASGLIDFRMVNTIYNRTDNILDEAVMARVDEALAAQAYKWMKLSKLKLRDRIDSWVAKLDPDAVRVPPSVEDNRHVDIAPDPHSPGMADVSASLRAADGAAFDQRLDALAATVCENDPRTTGQRRADATGAVARGETVLACECGAEDCPAQGGRDTAAAAVIHVLAEEQTLTGASLTPGYLPGFGILPAEAVRELAATATLQPLSLPTAQPEPAYRPSAGLALFLRWRDLSCCWPGCDQPVTRCDIDHTVAWPAGPTHPANNKHYCRTHHLIKTFYAQLGWRDQQLPDGTVILTSPTGHTYTSRPHGGMLFPALAQPAADLPPPPAIAPTDTDRSMKMPRRTTTRAQNRAKRIETERRQRNELNKNTETSCENPYFPTHPPPPDDNDPPPF